METQAAVQLAREILADHFGDVVSRVGVILLERGSLALGEIMRFVSVPKSFTDTPMKFPQVRNALLAMVQHCIVSTKPHPQADTAEAWELVPQVYTIHIEAVLSRCRFPHYLEVVQWMFGEDAQHILLVVLVHGRATQSVLLAETQRERSIPLQDAQAALQMLLDKRFILPVAPYVAPVTAAASSTASAGTLARDERNGDAKRPRLAASGDLAMASKVDTVFCLNRRALDLCLYKCLLERIVEERLGSLTSQALSLLLSKVELPGDGGRVQGEFLRWRQVQELWNETFHEPGRDPAREHEHLKRCLETLTTHRDGLVRKRIVQVTRPIQDNGFQGMPLARPGDPSQGSDNRIVEEAEWTVEWHKVREVVVGAVRSQLLRDRFGTMGFRIFNLLNETTPPQKLEENEIFHVCMVPQTEGREMLNAMVRGHVLNWQEVSKSSGSGGVSAAGLKASYWLYYVDRRQVEETVLQSALKAMLNLRIRFRIESMRTPPLESRLKSLSPEEQRRLAMFRRREDILERSFLLLDAVILGLEYH